MLLFMLGGHGKKCRPMNKPFATIIIPTYNQEAFLAQALESVLSQTDADWEAIIVNDGSTDRTAEIAESYVRRDGRIRCINKPNGGVASALNVGLKNARGDWIHWLSSDDMFEANKLAINRRWIERHHDCNFFFSYFTLLRQSTGTKERRGLWGPLPDPAHQILTLFYRNYVSGITICIRRTAWEAVGFFDESLYYAQDYGQWLRLLQKNQAVFIPEWTVINRNHDAQGSETFADACYFDTAKAAILFINQHAFPELVPWTNLRDHESATKAVTTALNVACDRSAFLYSLGVHPALILRVLEWVCSGSCVFPELRNLTRSRIGDMSFGEGDDDWVWMWRQLAVAVHDEEPTFNYAPIDVSQLGLRQYQNRVSVGEPSPKPLRDYLARFGGLNVEEELPPTDGSSRIVLLIDRMPECSGGHSFTDKLARRGYRIVWLSGRSSGASVFEWTSWASSIRVSNFGRDILPWLGEVECVVTLPGIMQPTWLASVSHIVLDERLSAADIEQDLRSQLRQPSQQSVRPVVFLERVLWGGGAERVVFDIVRHLDRKRFQPVLLTMFDEQTDAPTLPQDIGVFNIRREVFAQNTNEEGTIHAGTNKSEGSTRHRLVHGLRRIYHGLLTPDVRMRIGIGQRLITLKRRFNKQAAAVPIEKTLNKQTAEIPPTLDCDFISAMACHNPAAVGLARTMSKIGHNAVLVTVMEEAAVVAWLAQAALRFPYIVSLHTFESACLPTIYQAPERYLAEQHLLAAACNDAEMVVFPTEGCCADMKQAFSVPRARIRTISNPVDCARVRRRSFQRVEAVERWRDKAQCFRMVHVGRLDPQKNHDLLLAACGELKTRCRQFSLCMVGDGHDRANIEKRIDKLGLRSHAFLVGEQSNPFPWIAAANALVLTSRFEAFALVLVEAMACGVPVVSVDCPAGPREVLNKGQFGLLVPNNDPVALADAMERLMTDASLARQLSITGYQRAQSFDVKKIMAQWESIIGALPMGQG